MSKLNLLEVQINVQKVYKENSGFSICDCFVNNIITYYANSGIGNKNRRPKRPGIV